MGQASALLSMSSSISWLASNSVSARRKATTFLHLAHCIDLLWTVCDPFPNHSLSVVGLPRLDLRFVPDEQSFEGRAARDAATEVPPGYVPPPAFATAALQHTNVKLTWDADDAVRKRTLARKLTQEQLHDDDFRVRARTIVCPVFLVHGRSSTVCAQ